MDRYLQRSSSNESLASKRPANDDGDWLKPKRPPQENVSTKNRFTDLPTDDISEEGAAAFRAAISKKPPSKVPPIFLAINQDWTHESLKHIISKYTTSYRLQYKGNGKVAIYCDTANHHQALKDGLRSDNVLFHTFSRKDEKPYKVVIRGLPESLNDALKEELLLMGFKDVTISVIKSSTLYLAQLPPGTDIKKFCQIR